MRRTRAALIVSSALLVCLAVAAEALTITVARVTSGAVEVTGRGAAPNAPLTWEGVSVGAAARNGTFRFGSTALPLDCIDHLSDGITTTSVAVQGCGPQGPPGPAAVKLVNGDGVKVGDVVGIDSAMDSVDTLLRADGFTFVFKVVGDRVFGGNSNSRPPHFSSPDCSTDAFFSMNPSEVGRRFMPLAFVAVIGCFFRYATRPGRTSTSTRK
jgi:hypothetical protein